MPDTPATFSDFTTLLEENIQSKNLLPASKVGRELLKAFNIQQVTLFKAHYQKLTDVSPSGDDIDSLLFQRSAFVDHLLKKTWQIILPKEAQEEASLIAVGGYGRKELHPYSDIDILIISEKIEPYTDAFSSFITFIWDLGFHVGHAIRSFQETIDEAKADVSTATNLLESRWLTGNYDPFQQLGLLWRSKRFWPSQDFFDAKLTEQKNRHARFNNALYQLEPNIKESLGGLRDLQTLLWVAKRHFGANSLQDLIGSNFITNDEFHEIKAAYHHLNKVRFALHSLKNRPEDRLLFDNQELLADAFGFKNTDQKIAVEQFMSEYYQNSKSVVKLNEILLQHFSEEIFNDGIDKIVPINPRFCITNQYLDVRHDNLFQKNPTALLETFIILSNYRHIIKGIRSRTIRLIRNNLHLINDEFRKDPINKALFIEIFRQPKGVHSSVTRMHGYGILGAYIPAFEKITGLMQFDMFHAYTVDEHTILVVRNLRRFFLEEHANEFPTAHEITKTICKPEILILSGIFHDIAKGRGGKHEVLGAEDTKAFSFDHNLSAKDSELLYWLVIKHLDFSSVAQRKDLTDPEVIRAFATLVETQEKLDYLYLLTVADVRSTSDKVWNEWKNTLFLQLYNATTDYLDNSTSSPKSRKKLALLNKEKARELLINRGIAEREFQPLWRNFDNTLFFSNQSHREITRITKLLCKHENNDVLIQLEATSQKGASELIILMPGKDYLFAHYTFILEQLNLNIVEAKTYSGINDLTMMIIYFLDKSHQAITDPETLDEIKHTLQVRLVEETPEQVFNKRESRQTKCFDTPTDIKFDQQSDRMTELSINTKDVPGLLAKIGQAFRKNNIRVHDARINTVGEKAEDVFLISNIQNKAIVARLKIKELTESLIDEIEG